MSTAEPPVSPSAVGIKPRTMADLLESLGVAADCVMARPAPGTATPEDVSAARSEGRLCELVDGVLVEKAMGYLESRFACVLIYLLETFLIRRPLGVVAGPDGMILLAPGLVRIPDVSFVSRDQFPGGRIGKEPVPSLSPTLAVEILSQGNIKAEMDRKLKAYFASGSKLVWFLDPRDRSVRVFTTPDHLQTLDESQVLDGGEVLPGLQLPIGEWFERAENPLGGI